MVPFFSLVLPCYNMESYLERCVRSMLEQSFREFEIILVDDGSRDRTPEICDRLAAENACIRVIHKPNGGLSSARNAGLELAAGQYVWFVDPDDWIEPGALDVLHRACMAGGADIVKFDYFRAADTKKLIPGVIPEGGYEREEELFAIRRSAFCAAGKYVLSVWGHIYRIAFLREYALNFVSERIVCSEDYLFNLRALMYARRMQVLAQPLYTYVLRAGSLTQAYKPDLAQKYAELHRQLKDCCRKEEKLVDRFYVWHLVAGTCIPHEYGRREQDVPLRQSRQNVRAMLRSRELKRAVIHSDKTGIAWKKWIQLLAMHVGFEPLFYYLHIVKPRRNSQG